MNGLIIKTRYLYDILNNIKKIELRGFRTKIRGTIVLLEQGTKLAIGTVDIIDCNEWSITDYKNRDYKKDDVNLPFLKLPYKHTYAYTLANPRFFKTPKQYIHPRGAVTWVKLDDKFLSDCEFKTFNELS